MGKYLTWKQYQKQVLQPKNYWGFVFETARESMNNLVNYFLIGKKKFLSFIPGGKE